jgi:hypothetical protein
LYSTEYKRDLVLLRYTGEADEAQKKLDGDGAVVQAVNTPRTTAIIDAVTQVL